ncbi:MAG: metallophosphoesterase [Chlorobium sp.]|nr:MAG: metallophosphoesterase [Chlorobium sp.]
MPHSGNSNIVRFGIITDIHFSTKQNGAATAKETAAALRSCLDCWRQSEVDFVVQLGDLIKGSDHHKEEELQQVTSILNEFEGTFRHVIGNHCLALPRKELMSALGLQKPYYTFQAKGFRFIVLDGMDVSAEQLPETAQDRQLLECCLARPELHDYCGAVGEKQKAWLFNQLREAEQGDEKVIVICHFPLLPLTTDTKYGLLWNHREIVELLTTSPALKACLGGHYHYGAHAEQNGIHFVVMPAFVNRSEHPGFACGTVELQNRRMVIRNQKKETLYDLSLTR